LTSDAIFLTLGSILPNAPRPDSFLRLPSRSVENIHPERVTSADPKKPGRVRLACALLKPRSLGESSHPQVGPPARRGRCAGEMVHDPGPAPPDSLMLAHRTCLKTWGQFLPPPWWPSVLQREGLDAELRAVLEVQRRRPMPCRSRSGPSSPGSSGGPATPVRSRTSSRAGGERGAARRSRPAGPCSTTSRAGTTLDGTTRPSATNRRYTTSRLPSRLKRSRWARNRGPYGLHDRRSPRGVLSGYPPKLISTPISSPVINHEPYGVHLNGAYLSDSPSTKPGQLPAASSTEPAADAPKPSAGSPESAPDLSAAAAGASRVESPRGTGARDRFVVTVGR
jgi:hypothetical protein